MPARSTGRHSKPSRYFNWLEDLDRTIKDLPAGSNWLDDSRVASQRSRRFIMSRFPRLLRPFSDEVLSRELARGERQIADSTDSNRILRGLNPGLRSQLAALLLDLDEALATYDRHRRTSKSVTELAAEADRRLRKLSRKTLRIRRELQALTKYVKGLNPLLQLRYSRAAERCVEILEALREDGSVGEYYRSLKAEYPALENPKQLGMVALYWFFRHGCGLSGRESEVRVAIIVSEFLTPPGERKLKYLPAYRDAESQGSAAVRLAVSRYRPRTTN